MWRLNLYTRYLEKDNGVYVQIEFVALSRSAPGIVGWVANPYIRSIPMAYLTNYLRAKINPKDFLKTLSPMGTISDVQDIVEAVVYLTEARQVTGEVLHVDGGAHSGKW